MRERQRFEREIEFLQPAVKEYDVGPEARRQEECRKRWAASRDKLPQAVKNALDNLDFEAAVDAAVKRGWRDVSELTSLLFYAKYWAVHGYCGIKKGARIPGGDSYEQAWVQLRTKYVTPKLGVPMPVIDLEKIKIEHQPETRLRYKNDGTYEGWFTKPVHVAPEPQSLREIKLSGRLKIADKVARRNYDAKKDGKKYPLGKAQVWAPAKPVKADGPVTSSAGISRVKADGTFTTSTNVTFDGTVPRFVVRVVMKLPGSADLETSVELKLVGMDVARFLAFVEPKEKARPASQMPLEFLASVRKIYQGGPNDPLKSAFDAFLYRTQNVKVLFAPDSPEAKWLKYNEVLYADGEIVDIGHVLTGIEGSPRQKPNLDASGQPQNLPAPPAVRDTYVTWAGDLGSVFQYHMPDIVNAVSQGRQPDFKTYIEKRASRADLIGDIDGINLGSGYDGARSLAENFNAYYGRKSLRRFHEFVANSLDENRKPGLPLEPESQPPKLSAKARDWIALSVYKYLVPLRMLGRLDKNVDPAKKPLIDKIVEPNSPQVRAVADYFAAFLEEGLAREM